MHPCIPASWSASDAAAALLQAIAAAAVTVVVNLSLYRFRLRASLIICGPAHRILMQIYVSQGSVAPQLMRGGIFNNHVIAIFSAECANEKNENLLIFGEDMEAKFLAHRVNDCIP